MREVMTYEAELEAQLPGAVVANSYVEERVNLLQSAEDACGIDPQRLMLWRVGVVALTGSESRCMQQAQAAVNQQLAAYQ